MNSLWITEDCV